MTTVTKIKKLVRPFIAVSFTLTTVALLITGKLEAREVLTITAVIIGFYFGERSALKNPELADIPEGE